MNQIASFACLLIGSFMTCAALAADPLVVDLWPGNSPGDVGIEGQENSRFYESPIIEGPTKQITNVTHPTITIYQPAKDKNTGTAMLICPGGGYHNLFWELEGEEVTAWLNSLGMTGIILKYRCPRRPGDVKGEPPLGPLLDAQRAVSLVRCRAAEWGIDPQRIGMVGFSAGGHLALATATSFEKRMYEPIDAIDEVSCRPDFAVLCYSGYLKAKDKDEISQGIRIPAGTPPIFLAHSSDDNESAGGSNVENSVIAYLALKRAGIPAELHVYATGDHDFGVRQNEKLPSSWTQLCVKWLRSQDLLKPQSNELSAAEDVADIPSLDLHAQGDEKKRYFLIGLPEGAATPTEGYGFVVVLPGGPGSADFHPFVKRIYKHALPEGYLVAQPVAMKWTEQQQVVWPTEKNSVENMGFSTEEFVAAVIRDVQSRAKLDAKRVFTLSWSSSGPAAYAISLTNPQVTGSFVAMSVFKPSLLPPVEKAKGHRYFLYHSPDDRVCPFSMAELAANDLERSGATVKVTRYQGGHGWRAGLYADIRDGIEWLEAKPSPNDTTAAASENILLNSGIEDGDDSPAHWSRGAAIEGVEYDWDKDNGQKGNASLCLNKTADRYFPIAQWSQTVQRKCNGLSVQVSAQVKAESITKAVIDVIFLDDKAKPISHKWAAYIGAQQASDRPTTHDWKEYSGRVAIPPGTSTIQIGLQIYGPGKVWFDEVRAAYAE